MSDLETDALEIAKYMYEHKHTPANPITVSKLKEAVALSPQDFEPADGYLNQAKYITGTMGGDSGRRWLTTSGIQFVTSRSVAEKNKTGRIDSRNVFVVHGQDNETKESVARFLDKLDLVPVILHEQPSAGKTIIEKFEHYSDVGFAVVLLTPDDLGANKDKPEDLKPRARQNVIFELGYFFAKLERKNVCVLYKQGVEILSDISGIVYILMDEHGAWKSKLAQEIRQAGLNINLNKI